MDSLPIRLGLTAVVTAVTDETPRVLVVPAHDRLGHPADSLPTGPFNPETHRTLDQGCRLGVEAQTRLRLGHLEQLFTFGDRGRDPAAAAHGARGIAVGYLALTREAPLHGTAGGRWCPWYDYFPYEDWREGRPSALLDPLAAALEVWVNQAADPAERRTRHERVGVAFGVYDSGWNEERVLERYELLYSARLIPEFYVDQGQTPPADLPDTGQTMALDYRRVLATAIARLRGKIKYRPVVFELLPGTFTLLTLQRVVEALAGLRLHKQNFRRLVESAGLVEPTGTMATGGPGRPAEHFAFRPQVLLERRAPGLRLPAGRS